MTIPEHVNFTEFYYKATQKGIHVTSRYAGVCVSEDKSRRLLFWKTSFRDNGAQIQIYFPFTKDGEIKAHKKYLKLAEGRTNQIGRPSKKISLKS
jgi:hypothetical protein